RISHSGLLLVSACAIRLLPSIPPGHLLALPYPSLAFAFFFYSSSSTLHEVLPFNGLFSGLAFLLLKLILPDSNLDFRAAYHLGIAKSAAIWVRQKQGILR
ncbi:MAG: hypothetical protein ABIG63_09965, partial [Chloroflexota bacterium]